MRSEVELSWFRNRIGRILNIDPSDVREREEAMVMAAHEVGHAIDLNPLFRGEQYSYYHGVSFSHEIFVGSVFGQLDDVSHASGILEQVADSNAEWLIQECVRQGVDLGEVRHGWFHNEQGSNLTVDMPVRGVLLGDDRSFQIVTAPELVRGDRYEKLVMEGRSGEAVPLRVSFLGRDGLADPRLENSYLDRVGERGGGEWGFSREAYDWKCDLVVGLDRRMDEFGDLPVPKVLEADDVNLFGAVSADRVVGISIGLDFGGDSDRPVAPLAVDELGNGVWVGALLADRYSSVGFGAVMMIGPGSDTPYVPELAIFSHGKVEKVVQDGLRVTGQGGTLDEILGRAADVSAERGLDGGRLKYGEGVSEKAEVLRGIGFLRGLLESYEQSVRPEDITGTDIDLEF